MVYIHPRQVVWNNLSKQTNLRTKGYTDRRMHYKDTHPHTIPIEARRRYVYNTTKLPMFFPSTDNTPQSASTRQVPYSTT